MTFGHLKTTAAAVAILAVAACSGQDEAATADGPEHSGVANLSFASISAVTETGQPDPADDAACQARYAIFIGQSVSTEWSVNTETLMESAVTTWDGTQVELNALGIEGEYGFMSDGLPQNYEDAGVTRVMFEISTSFENPESTFMAPLTDTVNCLITT